MAAAIGKDIVLVAGGLGLAPLRPALYHVLAQRQQYGKVVLLYGTRTPEDLLYRRQLEHWRARFDLEVLVTVDRATSAWRGSVGVVTKLIARAPFDPPETAAMLCGPEVMMRFTIMALQQRGVAEDHIFVSMERNMKCAIGLCGHCQFGPTFVCKEGSLVVPRPRTPTLAVWKFASCDGCQLSLLDCEDELLALAGAVEIAHFVEASRAVVRGPYDLSLVEGSITTEHDAKRIQQIRRNSKYLVTIGACATAGGIQVLRNFA